MQTLQGPQDSFKLPKDSNTLDVLSSLMSTTGRVTKKDNRLKIQSLFDIDVSILNKIKKEFPENQTSTKKEFCNPNQRGMSKQQKQMEMPKKYGLCVHDFIEVLNKHIILNEDKMREIEMALDHVHPSNITWKEF